MGAKIRCLKCKDVIESKHVHDFRLCSCENIFIDGGNDYTRYGGKALEDGSAEFILENGKTINVLKNYKAPFYGINEDTKIGLVRKTTKDPMYLSIREMISKIPYKVFVTTSPDSSQFFGSIVSDIKRSEEKLQTYKYEFTNNCISGKPSFGTEKELIATSNCPVLKKDGTIVNLGDLNLGDEIISIKRKIYNKAIDGCISSLYYSFKYYKEYVYNISFRNDKFHFCADGFFIGSLGECND